MSLFEKLNNKRSSLHEVKDDGIKKPTKKANKEVFNVTGKSAARDAKKYASGEYPKIGGGSRIGSKSKGSGAETGAKVNLNTTSGSKSKGTTPVKVNITKPIKQSEVSKKSKVFSKKIEKNQIVKAIKKDADRLVRKAEKGDKKARKKIFKVLDKRFKKLSPADQEIQAKKMYDVQKKMGRTFNPKTGNFEGPDTEFQKSLSKIKDSKGKRITSGPVSVTAGPEIRKRVEKIRDTRATKAGMPDPFKSTTKFSQKQFNKTLKSRGVKVPQVPLIPDPFGKGDTKGQMNVKGLEAKAFKKTQPKDVKLPKSFTDFSKKLKTYKKDVAKTSSSTPRTIPKKFTPTVGVKQSEVSKQAQEFTKNINQKRQTTTPSKSDVERIKQNKIDTQKADAFKKTAAYKNIAQGKDAQGNYLTPEQRKANFIKRTKQNKEPKEIKNKPIRKRVDAETFKTKKGNVVTQGVGQGSRTRVTSNKDFTTIMNKNKIKNTTTGKKKVDLPKFSKSSGVTNPSFMKKVMPKIKKTATPAAKAFSKAGPVGKLAAAALVAGGAIYGYNQIRKAFAGAGKPKAPPAVKGSALRYTSGPKKGQKKYFDIKTMKRDYFTPSDFRDKEGNIDAGFGKPDRDEKLIKRLRSTK